MRSIRYLGLATAAATVLFGAGAAVAAPGNAGRGLPVGGEGPAGPAARMPDGRIATPPAIKNLPASAGCPVPPYGAQFYAPGYPGYAKTVALTFDDGPGKTTGRIVRILHNFRAPATFFNIGQNMAARPALLRKEKRYGFALGNHTWSHPDLTKLTRRQQAAQIDEATGEQRAMTHTTPCVFRPPYGSYNAITLSASRDHRLAVWLWSVDTEDWKADGSASEYWVHRIIRLAEKEGIEQEHPVIIMHNQPAGNPATALALPTIIRFFRHHHYRLVTLLS
jgi:peptidoglycan/xylan/chitin deacetylase (PgdA/CDA1 family)